VRKSATAGEKLIFNSLWLTICTVNHHQERAGVDVFRLYHFLYFVIGQFLDNGKTTYPRIFEKLAAKKMGSNPSKRSWNP
jgi:hypothetical protein